MSPSFPSIGFAPAHPLRENAHLSGSTAEVSRVLHSSIGMRVRSVIGIFTHNDQLTDGGPSVAPELPGGVAGPPFGGALGVRLTWA